MVVAFHKIVYTVTSFLTCLELELLDTLFIPSIPLAGDQKQFLSQRSWIFLGNFSNVSHPWVGWRSIDQQRQRILLGTMN